MVGSKSAVIALIAVAAAFAVLLAASHSFSPTGEAVASDRPVRIGIVTDLSGPASYWGRSTQGGAQLAAEELNGKGIRTELVFEDYKLNSKSALTAAQKLTEIDGVDALYVEFNPATVPVASYAKDKGIIYVLDSAAVSVVNTSLLAFKTYTDYEAGCRGVAQAFKRDGLAQVGVLKGNMEFGDQCLQGVREVYPKAIFESYNVGDEDLSTQVAKLNANGAEAIIHPGFEGEVLAALKAIKTQGLATKYATVDEALTPKVMAFNSTLAGGYAFGFQPVTASFKNKVGTKAPGLSTYNGAALAYTHVKQMAAAIYECNHDEKCAAEKLAESKADNTIGFEGFAGRIAQFGMRIAPISEFIREGAA